jgi:G3E family GTPase
MGNRAQRGCATFHGHMTIAVTIIGGYLGAGKTTLVNHLLPFLDGRTVVLVNDFGSINIDGDLIRSTDGDTITLANGCVCCSMVDGLSAAIDNIGSMTPPPQRLIIETSGVAEPGAVAAYTHVPGFHLDAVVVVVDAETVRARADDRYVGDTVRRQLVQADIVILNKADLLSGEALAVCRSWLANLMASPVIIEAQHANVHPDVLVGLTLTPPRGAIVSLPGSTVKFHTASFVSESSADRGSLESWINRLPAHVVRVKGIVRLSDGTNVALHRVGNRTSSAPLTTWPGGPSRLVVISVDTPCANEAPPGFS